MKGKPDIDYDHDLYSLDEYPFASTLQGGAGAWVYPVDMNDQYAQAGQISSLYSFVQPGENFLVVPFSKMANEYYTAPNYYKMPGFVPSNSWIERKKKPRPPQIPLPQLVLPFLKKILNKIKMPEISVPPDMVPNPSPMHV
jgi:Deoxyribonuclease NucA/NucB